MITTGELRRRLVHFAGTGYPLLYLIDQHFSWGVITWYRLQLFIIASTTIALVLEGLRLTDRIDWAVYDALTREYEQDYLAGYALYMIGMAVTAVAFEPRVALPAILMLTIADPISGILSSGNLVKSLVVLLATFGVSLLLAAPFVGPPVAIAGAVVATIADGWKPVVATYVIDDNITIPIGAGAAMSITLTLV